MGNFAIRLHRFVSRNGLKEGQSHFANSPRVDLKLQLEQKGLPVKYANPIVPRGSCPTLVRLENTAWNKKDLQEIEVIIVYFKQCNFDRDFLDQLSGVNIQRWLA